MPQMWTQWDPMIKIYCITFCVQITVSVQSNLLKNKLVTQLKIQWISTIRLSSDFNLSHVNTMRSNGQDLLCHILCLFCIQIAVFIQKEILLEHKLVTQLKTQWISIIRPSFDFNLEYEYNEIQWSWSIVSYFVCK